MGIMNYFRKSGLFLLFVFLIFSCQDISQLANTNELSENRIYNRAGSLTCSNQITPQYDILALAAIGEWDNIIETLKAVKGEEFYDEVKNLARSALSSQDPLAWIENYGGTDYSSDFYDELELLYAFMGTNSLDSDFDDQLDSIMNRYTSDSRFLIEEINILLTSLETVKAYWQFAACEESVYATRGLDDDQICAHDRNWFEIALCNAGQWFAGAVAGALAASYACQELGANWTEAAICGAIGAVIGILTAILWDPGHCDDGNQCDDCRHPRDLSLLLDFVNCDIRGVEAFGPFEFAEQWDWTVSVASGNFMTSTSVPRLIFPLTFDANHLPFTVRAVTWCDGMTEPDDGFIEYYEETFSSVFPPIPWMILGPNGVDDYHEFRFEGSAVEGNLSLPIYVPDWTASTNVTIVEEGVENGVFYAIFDFSSVTTQTATITLTLHDDCINAYQTRTKTVRMTSI